MALKHLLKKRLIFLFLLVAITSFIFNACRKYDVQKNVTDSALIERFFKVPENASPQLKAIIADVRKQNERYNFVTYFIDKNGWPRWQDAEIVSGQQFVANIPFVKEGQTEINGFFFVKMDTANSHAYYELYRKNLYEVYSKSDRIRSLNPYSMQMVINHLNQKLYGIDTFRFYDEREVPEELSNSYSSYVDWRNVVCKLKPLAKSNSSPSITAFLAITCYSITTCYDGPVLVGDANNHPSMCYDEYYCYGGGGGGGDGGGGGWGPNPDPHGGGGGGGTNNPQTNPYWWQGGDEGDCRCPPPVRDSTFYKNYLAKTSDSIRTEAQNAYNTAQHNMEEWYFVMGGKDSSIKVRSKDTDHKQHYCRIKYIVFAGEKLIGEYHTHYNDEPPAYPPGRSCSIDAKDILALKPHTSVQDYVSFCDLGNEYQVYVIEDPVKATAFLKTLQPDFGERWEDSAYRYSLFSNYRERTLNFTKQFLGSSAITGIGLYKTIDIDKKNFIKLN